MISPDLEHTLRLIGWSFFPWKSCFCCMKITISWRALNRFTPFFCHDVDGIVTFQCPAFSFNVPSSFKIFTSFRSWRRAQAKSFASWAGVTFTTPVPNFGSTNIESVTIGILMLVRGWMAHLPCRCRYLESSGWTARAVSPHIVSGRVVATSTVPPPSTGNRKWYNTPNSYLSGLGIWKLYYLLPSGSLIIVAFSSSMCSTSMSESTVCRWQHQFTRRVLLYMRPLSYRRTNASVTAADNLLSMVNTWRDQSSEAPVRLCGMHQWRKSFYQLIHDGPTVFCFPFPYFIYKLVSS